MGKRSAVEKMNAAQSRIRDLGRFGHGCYYCKGNCYTAITPHLNNLQSWLLEAAKLKATTLDQELLWIFGKSTKILRGAEELRRSRQGGSSSSSTWLWIIGFTSFCCHTAKQSNCQTKKDCNLPSNWQWQRWLFIWCNSWFRNWQVQLWWFAESWGPSVWQQQPCTSWGCWSGWQLRCQLAYILMFTRCCVQNETHCALLIIQYYVLAAVQLSSTGIVDNISSLIY